MAQRQVLLIEDEPHIAEAIRFIQGRAGWQVMLETNGGEALARPAQPVRAVIDMAGRLPARFLAYAWCAQHPVGGFDGPVLRDAMMLLLPAPPGREGNERAVGSSCRICPRAGCPGRREPSILPER